MYLTKQYEADISKNDNGKLIITFAHTNKEDRDGDIFLPGAYVKDGNAHIGRPNHADGTSAGFSKINETIKGSVTLEDPTWYDTEFGKEMETIFNTPDAPIQLSYMFNPVKYKRRKASDGRTAIEYEKVDVFRVDIVDRPATYNTGVELREKMLKELQEAEEDIVEEVKEQECDIIDNSDMVNEDEELQLRYKFARLQGLEV